MNVSIIGHLCIDNNQTEKTSYKAAGSPAYFISTLYKQFPNVKSTIIANRGEDFKKYENDLDIIPKKAQKSKSLRYENIFKDGDRVQKATNREYAKPVKLTNSIRKRLSRTDILIFAPILANFQVKYVKEVISLVNQDTLKIMGPQGYFRRFDSNNRVQFREFDEAKSVIPLFDYTILSKEDYPHLKKHAKKWVRNSNSNIIITQGKEDAILINNNAIANYPTKEVENIVDSTGAGDIFLAAFAYMCYKTANSERSINFAHKIAGESLGYCSDDLSLDI